MKQQNTYINQSPFNTSNQAVEGSFVQINGMDFYKISHYDEMPPFFMSIVSDSDHWLFISSNGALTAGRRNPEVALFPYYTDDKIHDSHDLTGSKTTLRVDKGEKTYLWEPFSDRYEGLYVLQRHLYKNLYGNQLIFEEINEDLGLSFQYAWCNSDKYGIIRKAWIKNLGEDSVEMEILDGVQNILPFGVPQYTQSHLSTLVDAYKKSELDKATGLGMFMLSSIIVDRAEPSEALKCNTVWSTGLTDAKRLISSNQISAFRKGRLLEEETDIRAARGAYFLNKRLQLKSSESEQWYMVMEVNQSAADVAALRYFLSTGSEFVQQLEEDIALGTSNLGYLVASSDGLQSSTNKNLTARHFSNTLFNIMRGGVFMSNYEVQKQDLQSHVAHFNSNVAAKQASFLQVLPDSLDYGDLIAQAHKTADANLIRLCYEYMPLIFSRRHGDPSRPWNRFSIEVKAEDGSDVLYYAGNWRDIFQNWEALAYSFPAFAESMIAKFVNASTIDGYNPYRITREGIDWEKVEPDDPWSYIGYWGDHQIIYLQKLLEVLYRHDPEQLKGMLSKPIFAYANVPYRIKSYQEILENSYDTVVYDEAQEEIITDRVEQKGADGKLVLNNNGGVYLVNFTEKLLVSVLAKFSNFIPEAGIWLNTQRPEWNDANNALVGSGVSMVTLYYMRRFQSFCKSVFADSGAETFALSEEVAVWFRSIAQTLSQNLFLLKSSINDIRRKEILDSLGKAAETYRFSIYSNGFAGKKLEVSREELVSFFNDSLLHIEHCIRANKREDGLYHAYNLMTVKDGGVSIRYLYEMLEGQVAVLSSGYLSAMESLEVLKALRNSSMYRADQHSYILYPNRDLPRFLEKNNIPQAAAESSRLIVQLAEDKNLQLVEKDVNGQYHFNGNIRNADDVKKALEELKNNGYQELVEADTQSILAVFEQMFDHKSFTGRSGTFFGYEGLGSIYWHMVSKLLLAVQESYFWAMENGEDSKTLQQLSDCYYDVRAGIGFNKTPENYGAFPCDAYSHTPATAGAQQPGMTGQVKEDILSRWGELGIFVENGQIVLKPHLLKKAEFNPQATTFSYYDLDKKLQNLDLPSNSLAFTYCQTPVVYHLSEDANYLQLTYRNGEQTVVNALELDKENSEKIFNRSGEIKRVDIRLSL